MSVLLHPEHPFLTGIIVIAIVVVLVGALRD